MVQMLTGFQVAQALYVAAKLNIATELLAGPRPISDLAARTGSHPPSLARLLRTLSSLGVFSETSSGDVELTPLAATLVEGTSGSMRDLAITSMETHYAPFGDLLTTLKTGEAAATHYYHQPFFAWLSSEPSRWRALPGRWRI